MQNFERLITTNPNKLEVEINRVIIQVGIDALAEAVKKTAAALVEQFDVEDTFGQDIAQEIVLNRFAIYLTLSDVEAGSTIRPAWLTRKHAQQWFTPWDTTEDGSQPEWRGNGR